MRSFPRLMKMSKTVSFTEVDQIIKRASQKPTIKPVKKKESEEKAAVKKISMDEKLKYHIRK